MMVFHRSLSDNKSFQVSWTLLSILANLNNAVVWMVSIRPVIFKFSSPCVKPLVTVPRAPTTISITVTFMFHSFWVFFFFSISCQRPGTYPSFHLLSILFCGQSGQQSPQFCKFSFLLIIIRSGRQAEIRWSVGM